jgi:MFS family permease
MAAGQTDLPKKTSWADLFRGGLARYTIILNLGVLLYGIDIYLIASIMPTVIADVGGLRFYTWTFIAFSVGSIIGTASAEPIRRSLGRRYGYSLAGLIFLIGITGSALSGGIFTLISWRFIQGLGGGSIVSQSYSIIGEVTPSHLRARALSFVSITWGLATIVGPTFGGVFAELGSWRGAFWTVVPLAVLFTGAVWMIIPHTRISGAVSGIPASRLALIAAAILCLSLSSQMETMTMRLALAVLSLAMTAAFFMRDDAAANRMLPSKAMSMFTVLGSAYWILLINSLVHTVIGAFGPLFLQVLHAQSPLIAAWVFALTSLFWTVGAVLVGGLAGRAVAISIGAGLVLVLIGTIGVALFVLPGPVWAIALSFTLVGLGTGLCYNHLIAWSIATVPPDQQPVAASSAATMRALGIAYGAAIAGLLGAFSGLTDDAPRAVFENAMTVVYNSNVLVAVIAVAAGLILWRNRARMQTA